MSDWTNWTDKQDTEVLDRVYRMRPNGTMSTANTVPYSDMIEHHKTFKVWVEVVTVPKVNP